MHLDVRVLASPLALSRIGIVVPRHQHSAVDRNRLKRRLRELARLELLPALRGNAAIDIASITAFCKERLADFKVPSLIHVRDSLPKTPTERIAKHLLR